MAITVTTSVHNNKSARSTDTYESGAHISTVNGELHIRREGGVVAVYAPGHWISAHEDDSQEFKYHSS